MMADITIGDDKYEEACCINHEFMGKSKKTKALPEAGLPEKSRDDYRRFEPDFG